MSGVQTLQRVVDSSYRIGAVETAYPEKVIALFKRLTMTTGQAVYHWQPDNGLYRLGAEHILIPRTRSPNDVLSYIQAARHYGVYVLEDFEQSLQRESIQGQIEAIIRKDDDVRRLVLFLGHRVAMPERLAPHAAMIRQSASSADAEHQRSKSQAS